MWIHKNKQQCLYVPIPISNHWTPLADQVKTLDTPESLIAIHHAAPLTKLVRFSHPRNHVTATVQLIVSVAHFLTTELSYIPYSLQKLQQHASHNPTPLTTTLCAGVINGTILSAVSNTGAPLHALVPSVPSIPTGIWSKVVFHLPNGTIQH